MIAQAIILPWLKLAQAAIQSLNEGLCDVQHQFCVLVALLALQRQQVLLLCLEPKDQLTTRVGRTHPPPQSNHKTPTGREDSVDNQAECLAQSDKHDCVMLPVCGNVNIAEKEGGGGGREGVGR